LMDEVFGEENFVANIIWQKIFSPNNSAKYFSENHDHIICYAKRLNDWTHNLIPRSELNDSRYDNTDEDSRGVWTSSDLTARNYYGDGSYSVVSPSGNEFKPTTGRYWSISKDKFDQLNSDKRIWWGVNGTNMPRLKRFLSEVKQGVVPQTIWPHEDAGHTQEAKREVNSILDYENSGDVFITPKPVRLTRRIFEIATDKDSIILDSFAGSGTTAHAVAALNAADGGNRRFVLVECEDYVDSITAERVRRVMQGVPTAKDEKLKAGYGGTFSYFSLGEAMEKQRILDGAHLPSYESLAAYVYFTATGEQFEADKIDRATGFIGESRNYDVFLIYEEDVEALKDLALDLARAKALPSISGKPRLVFAPTKYLDENYVGRFNIVFQQLPFEIYQTMEKPRR